MVIFFWDEEGLVIMNFEPKGTKGNSDHYTET
jgi:hypothetical protein